MAWSVLLSRDIVKAALAGFGLRLFHLVDELWDSLGFVIKIHHFSLDFDGVNHTEADVLGQEMIEEVDCGEFCPVDCH